MHAWKHGANRFSTCVREVIELSAFFTDLGSCACRTTYYTCGNLQRKPIIASYAYSYSYPPIKETHARCYNDSLVYALYKTPSFHGIGVSANVFINS